MQVVTIGRELPDNTILLNDDRQVSRHHAQLTNDNGQYYITDLNSRNGTYVNGKKVQGTQKLQMRDVVRLGNTTIPWLMYFDTNYVRQLNLQRRAQPAVQQPLPINVNVDLRPNGNNGNTNEVNGMAIAGFVFSFLVPLLGFIFSIIGISNAKSRPDRNGMGVAVAGLVISCLLLIIYLIVGAICDMLYLLLI